VRLLAALDSERPFWGRSVRLGSQGAREWVPVHWLKRPEPFQAFSWPEVVNFYRARPSAGVGPLFFLRILENNEESASEKRRRPSQEGALFEGRSDESLTLGANLYTFFEFSFRTVREDG